MNEGDGEVPSPLTVCAGEVYAGAALHVESLGPKSLKTIDPVGFVPPASAAVS